MKALKNRKLNTYLEKYYDEQGLVLNLDTFMAPTDSPLYHLILENVWYIKHFDTLGVNLISVSGPMNLKRRSKSAADWLSRGSF